MSSAVGITQAEWWHSHGSVYPVRKIKPLGKMCHSVERQDACHSTIKEDVAMNYDIHPTEAAAIQAGITWAEEQATCLKIRLSRVSEN